MKKLLTLGLSIALALTVVSCGSKDVTILLPATYVGTESINELVDDLDLKDASKITMNEDGTATVVLTEAQRKAERSELDEEFSEEIRDLYSKDSDDRVASFVNIDYDKAYTKFDVFVDSATLKETDKLYTMSFLVSGEIMQSIDGVAPEDIDVQVNYIDNTTKETVYSRSYKEVMEAVAK